MESSKVDDVFEVIIIGAGISGIIAAQRYLEAHPQSRLTLLEKDHCVGGVFGKRRLYKEFWTQWSVGTAEFSDMPMDVPPDEDIKNGCFKAKYTTQYLEKYVDEKRHSGVSLRERVQFGINVKSVEKVKGNWLISCDDSSKKPVTFTTTKLMIANGENSLPNMPALPGRDTFGGVILHSEDFGASNVLSSDAIKHIAVLGAGKSSADMIYEAVRAGKTVYWLIRNTGTGAGFFAPVDLKTPYNNGVEAAQTRIMSSLQPSVLNPTNRWTWFLHSTSIGVAIVKRIFKHLDTEIRKRADYTGRKSTKGFEKLDYDTEIFWQNGTGGAMHHDDLWELVAQNVQVYRDEVKMLSDKEVYLSDGTHFPCDAILCGTGWKPGIEIFTTNLQIQLGLPHHKEDEPYEMTTKWEELAMEADEKITQKFLLLANPPPHPHKNLDTTPYRLYNCMAPLNDNSILFMNHITAGNKLFAAETQAIWAVAYFDGNIRLPSIEEREKEIATWIAWCKRRYLSNGERGNFAGFDSVPYADKLLNDIGLTAHREGWWKATFAPFRPRNLGRAWNEYLDRYGDNITRNV